MALERIPAFAKGQPQLHLYLRLGIGSHSQLPGAQKFGPKDWDLVVDIASCAAESMKEKSERGSLTTGRHRRRLFRHLTNSHADNAHGSKHVSSDQPPASSRDVPLSADICAARGPSFTHLCAAALRCLTTSTLPTVFRRRLRHEYSSQSADLSSACGPQSKDNYRSTTINAQCGVLRKHLTLTSWRRSSIVYGIGQALSRDSCATYPRRLRAPPCPQT